MAPPAAVVEAAGARRMAVNGNGVIIDARPADFYRQKHVKDAVNLPKNLFNFVYSMKISALDPATPLVVYGRTFSRRYDEDVARELELLGHTSVTVMDGGLDEWQSRGYEVEP
jgi:rhodanese-related sulfurtransferase